MFVIVLGGLYLYEILEHCDCLAGNVLSKAKRYTDRKQAESIADYLGGAVNEVELL